MDKGPAAGGVVLLVGSGETAASGRRFFERAFQGLEPPVRVAVLETPAGFEPNSAWVARQVGDFLEQRMRNHRPIIDVVPARKRGTEHSPDAPGIVAPLHLADVLYLGAGSPTYAVRQLHRSLAWRTVVAMHRLGARVVLASAATLAAGAFTLPVYEIFKVGEDLHWVPGLDLLGPFGLTLAAVPHWDNTDGGEVLDTSRCYIGRDRFDSLLAALPAEVTVVGLEEHTALAIDLAAERCAVVGRGGVVLRRGDVERRLGPGEETEIEALGPFRRPEPDAGLPEGFVGRVRHRSEEMRKSSAPDRVPGPDVLDLVSRREAARAARAWSEADRLRDRVSDLGWEIGDTPDGPRLAPIE